MDETPPTLIDRIRTYLLQKRYSLGMRLAVHSIYPDANPADFQLLDTQYFVPVLKDQAAAAGLDW